MEASKDDTGMTIELNDRERALIVNGLRNMWNMQAYAQIAISAKLSDTDPAYSKALEAADQRLRELRALANRLGSSIFDSGA